MHFITTTVDLIKKSIFAPQFYNELIANTENKTGIAYLLRVTTVIGILVGISLIPSLLSLKTALIDSLGTINSYYPSELKIGIEKGILHTEGVTEPFSIALPKSDFFASKEEKDIELKNAVVIDTQTPFSIEYFKSLSTFALVQERSVSIVGDKGEIKTTEFPKDMNVQVSKPDVDKLSSTISVYIERIAPFFYVFVAIAVIFALFIGYLLYGIYFALVTWIFARLVLGSRWRFKTAYRVGLHAMTLAIIFINLIDFVYTIHVPFVFTAISLAVLFANTHTRKTDKEAPLSSTTI